MVYQRGQKNNKSQIESDEMINWSKLYRPAFENVADKCGYAFSDNQYQPPVHALDKYNTKTNPRENEVTSDQTFSEIISGMDIPAKNWV